MEGQKRSARKDKGERVMISGKEGKRDIEGCEQVLEWKGREQGEK